MKKITLLTTKHLEGYTHDDHLLVTELEKRRFKVVVSPWEDIKPQGDEDLFLIRTTWNYTEHLPEFFSRLAPLEAKLANEIDLIQWNSNKIYLKELEDKGVEIVPTLFPDSTEALLAGVESLGGAEFIAKPLVSASAKGLKHFSRQNPPSINKKVILQKFYPEIAAGETSLIFFNGVFSHGVKKTPKSGDIRVQEEHGGIISPYQPTDAEISTSKDILALVPKPTLYARVDFLPGIGLMELELIEPALYFSKSKSGPQNFAQAIENHLN